MSQDGWLSVGSVAGVFGVRGAVNVVASDPEIFLPGYNVMAVTADGTRRPLRVSAVRKAARHLVVHFDGINDPDAARQLRGANLVARRSDLPPLPAGVFRAADLVGLTVRDSRLGELGTVRRVVHYPAADMLLVGDRGILVPLLRAYRVQVNLSARRIEVELPPGFEDLL
jgi:16S rRNA processing protein RimM